MNPSLGRPILFYAAPATAQTAIVARAAIISHVHSDTMVNLAVFDANGLQFGVTSVQLVQPGQPRPEFGNFCEWTPHQIENAKNPDTPVVAFVMQRKTADALERIIQKVDEQIQISG
nr:hypothetical protein [Rhodoferax sp.]